GNHYKRGDIIAEIDSRDFRIRKERASALYEQLKAEYERISVLYEKGNVSANTFEKAKADYISAKAAYDESCNALLHNDDGELLSGMSGKAHIVVDENEDTAGKSVAIPLQALCHRPGIGDFVWVVDKNNSTVKMRKVSGTELKADGIALIKEGLKEGEIVATTGLRFLSDGMCVNLNR
ncbi:MAG: efflux RND transporter periplasmic adaptor subunit, partial [Candidatus Cryptobacteroides sp.]